jgi:hypothetical protein
MAAAVPALPPDRLIFGERSHRGPVICRDRRRPRVGRAIVERLLVDGGSVVVIELDAA